MSRTIELFAGSGGMSQGMAMLGIPSIGVEYHEGAVATARAAGHERIHSDVSDLDPRDFAPCWGFHASPPCQAWSKAGQKKGTLDKDNVLALLDDYANGRGLDLHHQQYEWADERSHLAAEPMRWIYILRPEWITMEEVESVLPIWEEYALYLQQMGYSTWTGKVSSEEYGVPQTRKRAILIANRTFQVAAPRKTHRVFKKGVGRDAGDPELRPWLSMVDGLGWGMTSRPSMVVTGGGAGSGGAEPFGNEARWAMDQQRRRGNWVDRPMFEQPWTPEDRVGFPRAADELGPATEDGYRARDFRSAAEPAATVTSKYRAFLRHGPNSNATVRSTDEPAATVFFGNDPEAFRFVDAGPGEVVMRSAGVAGQGAPRDPFEEPAMTITGAGSAFWEIPAEKLAIQTPEYEIDRSWPAERPSTAIAGRGLVQHPGATANRFNGSKKSRNDGVRITVDEAAMLQSMPYGYPWQGSKTQQFQRVGDLVPARLAAYVVGAALGVSDYVDYVDRHYWAGCPWGATA